MGEVEKSMDIPCQARGQHWKMYFYVKFSMFKMFPSAVTGLHFQYVFSSVYPKTQSYHRRETSCVASGDLLRIEYSAANI